MIKNKERSDKMAEKEEKMKNEEVEKKEREKVEEKEMVPKEDYDALDDHFKRILAEFENFKKRSKKERESLYNSILSDVVESILPILDNLENAVKAETQDENYKQGVELVLKQFNDVLKAKGVEEIEALGETFDPELHDAVRSVQDESKGEKEVVEVYRKGYKIGSKVIRHSMVGVAN